MSQDSQTPRMQQHLTCTAPDSPLAPNLSSFKPRFRLPPPLCLPLPPLPPARPPDTRVVTVALVLFGS